MNRKSNSASRRASRLDGAPLDYAPENEQGVVFLFATLARKRFGLRVEKIRAGYPDCIAYRGEERIRIEFEYRSKNFSTHGHSAKGCDWIVCWKHDWPSAPANLRIVALRREYGLGFNVWIQPVRGEYSEEIARVQSRDSWSVAPSATKGDLILFYRTSPEKYIADVFEVASEVRRVKADWRKRRKKGTDTMATIRRVAKLRTPLHLLELQRHPIIGHAGFIRAQVQGRPRVSPFWPELRHLMIDRNPNLAKRLKNFGSDRVS